MNYQILATELALPAYAGLSDQAAADAINAKTVAVDVTATTGADILEATTTGDYGALTTEQRNLWRSLIVMQNLHLDRPNTRAILGSLFGAGTQTRTNLLALQATTASWALLNLGQMVGDGHVRSVREGA